MAELELRTRRLVLRPVAPDDLEVLLSLRHDATVDPGNAQSLAVGAKVSGARRISAATTRRCTSCRLRSSGAPRPA